MATQGLLTITKNGQTHIKVVVGSDGYNVQKLADLIKERNLWDKPNKLWEACDDANFGTILNGRVIQYGKDGKLFITNHDSDNGTKSSIEEESLNLYIDKWSIPDFNPRWEYGTAPYILVVEAP